VTVVVQHLLRFLLFHRKDQPALALLKVKHLKNRRLCQDFLRAIPSSTKFGAIFSNNSALLEQSLRRSRLNFRTELIAFADY
jgi:hypothetical protein